MLSKRREKIEKSQTLRLFSLLKLFCDDGFQNRSVYQPTFKTLDIEKANDMFLLGNQKEYIILNPEHYKILHLL